jgi:pyruvate,water dikinase
MAMEYFRTPDSIHENAAVGGKARALAALRRAGLPIPPWVVLLPDALYENLTPVQRQVLQANCSAEQVRTLIDRSQIAESVVAELRRVLSELSPRGETVAVRSSASDEDGPEHSFAGQLDSFLFVPADQVATRIKAVWLSGFSERIVAYRREHGLAAVPHVPAVLIQRMIPADVSGVAFSADPVSGRQGVAVVSAVHGLGTGLVSGECDADTFQVNRDGKIVQRRIAAKTIAHRHAPDSAEGVTAAAVSEELANRPALDDAQVLAVAELARRAARQFGRPQDIEWALAGGELYLLQSRPITTLLGTVDPDGAFCLWDNSNIAESYNGITTPLTFSFARRAYEEVYRQFCRLLGVPQDKLEAGDEVFRHMLGLVRGRVYYNLLNWYRLLAMLPGFRANRGFMEQMMGVKEPLPETIINELGRSTWRERLWDRFRLFGSAVALVRHHFVIRRTIRRFYDRLNRALGQGRPDLQLHRPDELAAYYRDLQRQLLTHWDAPLINDFLAMIFFGVLGKLTRKWCGDTEGTLHNDLLCGEGGMISAEPALRVRALAQIAARNPPLPAVLCNGSPEEIEREIDQVPDFRTGYQEYLAKFGDRCLEELKLESPTLFDRPETLLRSVGQLARRLAEEAPKSTNTEADIRHAAERRVWTALRFRPLRRLVFGWALRHARARVRDRENLRFERTRLFGRVRMIVVEMGRKFHALGLLADPRDIFYLEVEEILGFVAGTATCTDLKALVMVRKLEFARYRDMPAPAERFETRGIVYVGNLFAGTACSPTPLDGDTRKGLGCCPGIVRGPVRVIRDPRQASLGAGEIMVAERTDPGWIMLFPSAAGVLVERGSLLSHSAIVARELGIPAVVSLTGVTHWLRDGDLVELDGSTGIVRKLADPNGQP